MKKRSGLYSSDFPPPSREVAEARIEILQKEIDIITLDLNDYLPRELPEYVERARYARLAKAEELQFLNEFLAPTTLGSVSKNSSITQSHKKAA